VSSDTDGFRLTMTIAAINRVAVGGGFEITLVCDFRVAARSATLGSHDVNINQPMTNGSTYLLPRLIGEGSAKLLAMTGEIISAEEAARIGLVSSVVDDQGLTATVEALVARLVSVGRQSVLNVGHSPEERPKSPRVRGLTRPRGYRRIDGASG
jgi:enoyl-CoA hydratase/carnithine racemase